MTEKEAELMEKNETGNGMAAACGSAVKLKRELGLFSAVNLILGVMIGSGIFVSPSSALEHSGSVALCLIIWTVSGIISLLGALSFAELGTVVGKSGAEYSYFQEAFGGIHKFWGPLPSFICAWIYVVILRPAEVAIIVMTFAEYAIQPFTPNLDPEYKEIAIKLASISALFQVNKVHSLKMSSDRNKETRDAVKREIKEIQARCKHEWNVIDNSPLDTPNIDLQQINEKALCYIEGLGTEIQNSNTPITADDNLLTSQFLKEIRDKTNQVEEYTAFVRGSIHDIDAEINRLQTLITITQEAKSRPMLNKCEVQPEHVHRAKERFQVMKNELHSLIHSLFPNSDTLIIETMGQLMAEHLNEESNGYIPITSETFQIIELLKDMKIVTVNPYNKMEVKLSY
ncbi:hypothetical protein HF086_008029 [Spodoptera exigua]|uniref:B(0,+)-type amino acid transporter 1 n=1 Tax=Spodoptera exigua TaxID=7107 RepID=A0A922M4D5_SPOEX|nr:hypothetical protein HF086_008029 [Spodoptera exigua]